MDDEAGFGIDEFDSYQLGLGGGGFLSKWQEDGKIQVWLHPGNRIIYPWNHNYLHVVKSKDKKDAGNTVVKRRKILCLEKDGVNKRKDKRHPDGSREFPPTVCPHCLLIEHLREQIDSGDLDWCEPVFEFKSDEETRVVYAGGLTGMFDDRDLTKEQKEDMRDRASITPSKAFLHSQVQQQSFVFSVIKHAGEDSKTMIAEQKPALFKAVQKAISDRKLDLEGSDEDPSMLTNPRSFLWKFDDSQEFSAKYSCVIKTRDKMPAHVREALAEDPPDISRFKQQPDWAEYLKSLQEHALIDMPFDDFLHAVDTTPRESVAEDIEGEESADEGDSDEEVEESASSEEAEKEEEYDTNCEHCGHDMGDSITCEKCGTVYEEDEDENYVIRSRPCANPDCMEKAVEVNYHTGSTECPQCGALHDNEKWEFELPKPKRAAKKKAVKKKAVKKAVKKAAEEKKRPKTRSSSRRSKK